MDYAGVVRVTPKLNGEYVDDCYEPSKYIFELTLLTCDEDDDMEFQIDVDAERAGNEARFINDPHDTQFQANCAFIRYYDERTGELRIGVQTIADVASGGELLATYGDRYWQNIGDVLKDARKAAREKANKIRKKRSAQDDAADAGAEQLAAQPTAAVTGADSVDVRVASADAPIAERAAARQNGAQPPPASAESRSASDENGVLALSISVDGEDSAEPRLPPRSVRQRTPSRDPTERRSADDECTSGAVSVQPNSDFLSVSDHLKRVSSMLTAARASSSRSPYAEASPPDNESDGFVAGRDPAYRSSSSARMTDTRLPPS
jgi:hypothetical protein